MDNPNTLIEVHDLSVVLQKRVILSKVSLSVHPREIISLIGPNGSGKTTLIRVILGLVAPTQGSVWRKQPLSIGYMPQKLKLDPIMPLTVSRFLRLGADLPSRVIHECLEEVGVLALYNHSMHVLSGGELQRVLLARALLRKPELLVLDEPVQGVDITGQAEFYRLISDIRDRYQCGVLMVSHDLHLVMSSTDTVICLNQHICCQGHPEVVSQHPEFKSLFGARGYEAFAVYSHHHNHAHSVTGEVLNNDSDKG